MCSLENCRLALVLDHLASCQEVRAKSHASGKEPKNAILAFRQCLAHTQLRHVHINQGSQMNHVSYESRTPSSVQLCISSDRISAQKMLCKLGAALDPPAIDFCTVFHSVAGKRVPCFFNFDFKTFKHSPPDRVEDKRNWSVAIAPSCKWNLQRWSVVLRTSSLIYHLPYAHHWSFHLYCAAL